MQLGNFINVVLKAAK